MASPALDASALLAYLLKEPGGEIVATAIDDGVTISTVNLAEVLSTLAKRGADPVELAEGMVRGGLLDGAISIEPFSVADAIESARLRPLTESAGLSLGDRACVAQARRLGAPVLTADLAWLELSLPVEVRPIRESGR
jgi:PIN domain nuclease of toxin-antitoxin system